MPVGTRVRANNVFGKITNNPLAAGAVTMNAPELALLPEVVVGDHAVLTLDPLRTNGEPEIVIVTAHAPGASSATIERGAYNTIDRQHPLDTVFVHAPVTEDVVIITDSANRPADPYEGQLIYETDTDSFIGRIAGAWQGLIPTGSVQGYAGTTSPAGWLLCDGAAHSRTTFANLFATIGTDYGAGDGSTTFNVPNFKGRVPVGLDAAQAEFDALGETGGAKTHTLTSAQMPSHTHIQNSHNHTQNSHNHTQNSHNHIQNSHIHNLTGIGMTANSNDHQHGVATGSNDTNHTHATNGTGAGEFASVPSSGVFNNTNTASNNQDHDHNLIGNSSPGTATNQSFTATNQSFTATNQGFVAVNQSTGGGAAHNNLQPYQVLNFIIKI